MPKVDVFYICDRRACQTCSDDCMHTSDITHAKNFRKPESSININDADAYFEKEENSTWIKKKKKDLKN